MDLAEIYFAFHRRATVKELVSRKTALTSAFGHVEAFGYTIDNTWFFFNPGRHFTNLKITHLHDEVQILMAERFLRAEVIYRLPYNPGEFSFPLHFSMNCVTQCAALIGRRAFTPKGFQRILQQENAEAIDAKQQGRSS